MLSESPREKAARFFDHCISNPPYQESPGAGTSSNNSANNIFHLFYWVGLQCARRTSMIFPGGRWMQGQVKSAHIAAMLLPSAISVQWFPNGKEGDDVNKVFPNVMINDGVSIVIGGGTPKGEFLLNGVAFKKTTPSGVLPLTERGAKCSVILRDFPKVSGRKEAVNPFALRSFFVERNGEQVLLAASGVEAPVGFIKAFLADERPGSSKRVRRYWLREDAIQWTSARERIFKNWKVCVPQGNASKCPERGPYFTIEKDCAVGESWLVVGTFPSEIEAHNYAAWLSTPLARRLLGDSKGGNIRTWGYYAPDLGEYSPNSEIFKNFQGKFSGGNYAVGDLLALQEIALEKIFPGELRDVVAAGEFDAL